MARGNWRTKYIGKTRCIKCGTKQGAKYYADLGKCLCAKCWSIEFHKQFINFVDPNNKPTLFIEEAK